MNEENKNVETTSTPPAASPVPPPSAGTPPAPPGASSKAILALVLGILSLVCCGFVTGIPAIIIGKQEMNAIKEGRSNKEGHSLAQVGFILGIVGTALACVGLLLYGLLMVFGISAGIMESMQQGA